MKYHFRSNDFFRGREKLIGILHVIEYSSFLPLQMRQFDLLLWVILALLDFLEKHFFEGQHLECLSSFWFVSLTARGICIPTPYFFFNRKKSHCDLRKKGLFFQPPPPPALSAILALLRLCMFCLNRLQSMQSHRAVLCQGIISISVLF